MTQPRLLAIVGPTASGKTALSIEVARRLGGEIISVDSRQVYRGMDIGTAKPTSEQRSAVPHYGLDLVGPEERFGAGRFAAYARTAMAEIQSRGCIPILVGGTGFFLRALTHPIFQEPALDPTRRAQLGSFLTALDTKDLHRWLSRLDPVSAERLADWGGRQRLLRALELPLLTGRTLPWWHTNSPAAEPPLRPLVFVLELPKTLLDGSIDRRVARMVEDGLVDEVRGLLAAGYDEQSPGMNATGYIELLPYLRGEVTLDDALEDVRRNTRAYARRQLTWLRRQLPEGAIRLDATRPRVQLVDEIAWAVKLDSAASTESPGGP